MADHRFPRSVIFLGLASLFTDVASEAIYPLLPIFLTQTLGASSFVLGVIEGIAESVASLTKFFSGYWSDRLGKRESIVFWGYSLCALARPLMGLVASPAQVLAVRFTDRLGKGIRTAPRDAWLGSLAHSKERGRIFGYHRAMDHTGAVLGPLAASAFLYFFPGEMRTLFLHTFWVGALGVFFIYLASRTTNQHSNTLTKTQPVKLGSLINEMRLLPTSLKTYCSILFLFTLGCSTDAFLILKLRELEMPDPWLPIVWALLHVVKMRSSTWGGELSDRIGRKKTLLLGWTIYGLTYVGFAFATHLSECLVLFLVYGLYFGLTESPEKALVTDLTPPQRYGTAFGLYHLTVGVAALPASVLFGWIWYQLSSQAAFLFGAALALLACILISITKLTPAINESAS